jgi:hypothetical protein
MERWEYGDPFEVAARREEIAQHAARECGSCAHKVSMEWKGVTYHGCEHKRRKYGARCKLYREKRT